jgi:hypothetical protein
VPETSWELRIERLGLHRSAGRTRTYASYQVFIDGVAAADPLLGGFMCESPGPGDNSKPGNGKRVEAGSYPLWTQFGAYRSIDYSTEDVAGATPMPALALAATGKRTGILIHPAHPPKLFLSSIGCLNPTAAVAPGAPMDFRDSRSRTIALIESLAAFSPQSFAHEVMTRIVGASVSIDGEPMADMPAPALMAGSTPPEPAALPISRNSALKIARWLVDEFGDTMRQRSTGKPYGLKHLCGIVCQETAYKIVPWLGAHPTAEILKRCVFDASGDYPGTARSAFPVNTADFRARMGDELTNDLIAEANLARAMQGWGPKDWVYKGYGIFQYDLQHVLADRAFFAEHQWGSFETCLDRATKELDGKLVAQGGDLWEAIRAYNGSGAKAREYRDNVRVFTDYCAEVTG